MKNLLLLLVLVTGLNLQAQHQFGWTTSLDVSVKASAMMGIAPTITLTEDYEGFRMGVEYSKSLSRFEQYRHNTVLGLIGINFWNATVELGVGSHFNKTESVVAWQFGCRIRYENRFMFGIKVGSDFANASIGFTPFTYNDRTSYRGFLKHQ